MMVGGGGGAPPPQPPPPEEGDRVEPFADVGGGGGDVRRRGGIRLPVDDINFVVVTDVHSWIGGHRRHEPRYDADYGDVLSFYRHLQRYVRRVDGGGGDNETNHQTNDDDDGGGRRVSPPPPPGRRPGGDVFFVMNGDFVDGTGLSTVPPEYLAPLLRRMPWDAVNVGNHELYDGATVRYLVESGFIQHWNGTYLTSNTYLLVPEGEEEPADDASDVAAGSAADEREQQQQLQQRRRRPPHPPNRMVPLGNRYTYLYGSNTNTTLLVFGFLYNFDGYCRNTTHVETVQTTVRQAWFRRALLGGGVPSRGTTTNGSATASPNVGNDGPIDIDTTDDGRQDGIPLYDDEGDGDGGDYRPYDAIVVLAHMDCVDGLVYAILDAIRSLVGPDVPVQFLTGHSHRRAYARLDPSAASFEAGHFLDTVGFVSFSIRGGGRKKKDDGLDDGGEQQEEEDPQRFHHVFLDANRRVLNDTLGDTMDLDAIEEGKELSRLIRETQNALGLNAVLGCASRTYDIGEASFDDPRSLWGLWLARVVPDELLNLHYHRRRGEGAQGAVPFDPPKPATTERGDSTSNRTAAAATTTTTIPVYVQRTGALRYSLFEGPVTVDDVVAVCPFNDTIYRVAVRDGSSSSSDGDDRDRGIPGSILEQVLSDFASVPTSRHSLRLPTTGVAPLHLEIRPDERYTLYVPDFHVAEMTDRLRNATPASPSMTYHPVLVTDPANPQVLVTTTEMLKRFVAERWNTSACDSAANPNVPVPVPSTGHRPLENRRGHFRARHRPADALLVAFAVVAAAIVWYRSSAAKRLGTGLFGGDRRRRQRQPSPKRDTDTTDEDRGSRDTQSDDDDEAETEGDENEIAMETQPLVENSSTVGAGASNQATSYGAI